MTLQNNKFILGIMYIGKVLQVEARLSCTATQQDNTVLFRMPLPEGGDCQYYMSCLAGEVFQKPPVYMYTLYKDKIRTDKEK